MEQALGERRTDQIVSRVGRNNREGYLGIAATDRSDE